VIQLTFAKLLKACYARTWLSGVSIYFTTRLYHLADMAPQVKYAGDPRSQSAIKKYSANDFSPEDIMPDGFGIIALTFGMGGMMLKSKYLALISLVTCLISIANARGTEAEIKQAVSSIMVAVFALFQSYIDLPVPSRKTT
jgi:MFS-type transporter involved in bile tolerance (Atg22 family)